MPPDREFTQYMADELGAAIELNEVPASVAAKRLRERWDEGDDVAIAEQSLFADELANGRAASAAVGVCAWWWGLWGAKMAG